MNCDSVYCVYNEHLLGQSWCLSNLKVPDSLILPVLLQITEKKDQLAKLEALDCGKPLDEAAWDIVRLLVYIQILFHFITLYLPNMICASLHMSQDDVAACFEYYADQAEALDAKQKAPISLPMETFKCHVLKQPIGVVALITPW